MHHSHPTVSTPGLLGCRRCGSQAAGFRARNWGLEGSGRPCPARKMGCKLENKDISFWVLHQFLSEKTWIFCWRWHLEGNLLIYAWSLEFVVESWTCLCWICQDHGAGGWALDKDFRLGRRLMFLWSCRFPVENVENCPNKIACFKQNFSCSLLVLQVFHSSPFHLLVARHCILA